MKFADKLAKMRKSNNLSQEQLADQLGVTRQSVSKWESGDTYPDMAKIIQICKILNCTLNDIMDDGVISEESEPVVKNKSTAGESIVKYFNDFLNFITKVVNMFFHMTFKCRLKMIIELIIVGLLIMGLESLVYEGIFSVLWNLFSLLPNKLVSYVSTIFRTIILVILTGISLVVYIHYFKIRYLDYYVTLTDKNATEQSIEEPIEENQNHIQTKDKEPVVIIRDADHSSSKFMDGLVNIIIFLFKCFLVLVAIPAIITVIGAMAALVFCLLKSGEIFNSGAVISLGILILGLAVVIFIYKAIFNQKQPHLILLIMVIASLLITGVGSGVFIDGIGKVDTYDESPNVEYTRETINYPSVEENDNFYISTSNVEFIIDETKDDIDIVASYPANMTLDKGEYWLESGREYYIDLYDEFGTFRMILNDLSQMRLRKDYNGSEFLSVKVTCNSKNKDKFAHFD